MRLMRISLLLPLAMMGCAMPASVQSPTSVGHSFASSDGILGGKSNENSRSGESKSKASESEAAMAPAQGANAAPGAPAAGGGQSASHPVSGVGLSTFFDSYNFNFPVPKGQALSAVANVSQQHVALEGGKIYLQIGLQTTDQLAASARQPLNVSFVFDKSGSMYGEKMTYAREAAKSMVDQLGSQDTFSLVTFDSSVNTLIAPSLGTDKETMKQRIEGIAPGSATNIDEGLSQGYKLVQSAYKADNINRVILMSDGQANVGVTDPLKLGERASGFAKEGVTLSTIGVGLGFNERFMTHLAEMGGGSFYFVNSPEDAQKAFAGEIKTLQRTVARNVKLAINLGTGVELIKVYGHSAKTVGQSLNVDSNDLIASQSKVILLELLVPPGKVGDALSAAKVSVDFDDVPFGGHKQAVAEANVRYTTDKGKLSVMDSKIASSVLILQAASNLIAAAEALDKNQTAEATKILKEQAESVSAKAGELNDQDLLDEAANLKQYLDRLERGESAGVLKKEMQEDAFQKQQGKKKVAKQAA